MDYAANPRRGCTDANPCQGVNLPKQLKPTPKGLMLMQWQAIHVNLVPAGEQDAANLAAFLIGSGWRLGEALALNVASVEDYGKGRPMWVTMSRVLRRNPDGTHTIAEAERKAQKSMRRIELDPATAAIVRARLTGKRHSDLVFTHDGRAWAPHNFRNRLTRARKSAGLENATIHWLRHTHVAWLAMSGAPLPELRKRIGHADITTTIGTYGGMIGDVGAATLGAFAALRDATPTVTNSSPKATIEGSTVSAMKKLALLTALPLLALTACSSGSSEPASSPTTVSATSASSTTSATSASSSSAATSSSSTAPSSTPASSKINPSSSSTSTRIVRSSTPPAPTAAASPRAARPTATRKTAAKTATCTNLGTGAQFPCTEEEYAEQEYADAAHGPEVTQAECRDKTAPGGYLACHAAGFNWGMTEQEMRQHDANASCATGTQLYWAEHPCAIAKEDANSITYNDGSVLKF